MGLPDDFYIRIQRIETPSQGYKEIALRTVAPLVEGEYKNQHLIREELVNWHKHSWNKQLDKAVISAIDILDSKLGAGSGNKNTTQLVIKLLWGVWPEELRVPSGTDWRPAKIASNILNYCGHDINSSRINKHAERLRSDAREKSRLR